MNTIQNLAIIAMALGSICLSLTVRHLVWRVRKLEAQQELHHLPIEWEE